MFLIAGLGNPDRKYQGTKHNVGFDVIDQVAAQNNISVSSLSMKGMCGKGYIAGQKVILLKPMTYMNLSGEAIRAYVDYYKLDPAQDLIVIYDDISLDPGNIRIREKGSAGGHNGMKSILQHLGSDQFARIRVGIGEKPDAWDLADYVLAPFSAENRAKINDAVRDAANALEKILSGDVGGAMTLYNKKKDKKP